ncbi:DNA-binding response regulator, LuxR family protein [Candidatus Vecturithrix granuli]|uniref:DNA-binding response regulator, LuxR family protein n=1 Tax=Vecturithrix granuli TaxID=1499967 RepID=A0A081C3F5_VECG1|nr:DNA-binding response regulator, LuxR family protein [Candidatus Vecturithrix granuli]
MFHWHILYFFCALLVGVVSLTIAAVMYVRTKTDWMPYYLYFYTVFTALVGLDLATYYLITNLLSVYLVHLRAISYPGPCVLTPLLTLSLPLFVHVLGGLPNRLQYFRKIAIVVGSEVILQHIVLFAKEDWELCEIIADVVILGMIVYSVILSNRAYHYAQEPDRKRLVSKFMLLLGFSLFCQVLDIAMIYFFSFFLLYPLAYCSIGVIFAHVSLRTILQPVSMPQPNAESRFSSPPEPSPTGVQIPLLAASFEEEAEFVSYGLSEREQEILIFVLKGCSNAEIAELAKISLSTVKAHLTNIYEKIGVKNRYELITYFSNPQFPLQKTEEHPPNTGNVEA